MLIKTYTSLTAILLNFFTPTYADDLISLFPLDKYDQNVSHWIKPSNPDYDKSLLSSVMQKSHFDNFYDRYFALFSPWNPDYVNKILHEKEPDDLKTVEQVIISNFSNQNKPDNLIGYGENFRPYAQDWIEDIASNINFPQFDNLTYQASQRAIAITNLRARVLPTDDPHFFSHHLAGQGYPFDNLQMSAVWAGTPLYILAETRDHAWSLVLTPDFITWVKSTGIARASNRFITDWTDAAKQHLAAITQTKTSIVDNQGQFLFSAYIGSVFPAQETPTGITLDIPVMNADHTAVIKHANVSNDAANMMPLAATRHHFAKVMGSLIGRPYGWGSMYFYNDCSAELKSLLTPFGIWLPRHSSDQMSAGKMIDMSMVTADKRLSFLMENGRPFLTIIYIGGHVIMYVGNYTNPVTQTPMAMTYQNLWGLSPKPATRRAVIGKSVLFPMLLQYPEDASLSSLADKKYFQVAYLDQVPDRLLKSSIIINLHKMMYPNND